MRTCLSFLILLKFKEKLGVLLKKNISDGEEMTENVNYNRGGTGFASVEGPLTMYRTASNETTLVSESSNIINEGNVIIALGKGKIPVSILTD